MHKSEEKKILRQEIKKRIDDMDTEKRHGEGRTLSRILLKSIPEGSTVCAYFPLKSEVDIRLLLKELLDRGDTVYLPVFAGADTKMIYRKAENLHNLSPGEFTIPEPPANAEELGDKEVDIRLLLKELLDRGDTVYLPVFAGADTKMIYRKAENLHNLPPGEFTIPEPPKSAEELGDKEVDIILVPGRAFDRQGNRLGRGSGGYDTWLEWYKKHHPRTPLWGTCLQCQLMIEVPTEPHDVLMNAVITANDYIEISLKD